MGEISKKVHVVDVAWACIEKRRRIRRQEIDGMEVPGKRKRSLSCRRENCQGKQRKIELNGGVS